MPRQKLSEYRAKHLLAAATATSYTGWSVDTEQPLADQLAVVPAKGAYVIKVDQAVKGRFKQGLVKLDRTVDQLANDATDLQAKGYRYLLVEPWYDHSAADERSILAMSLQRTGTQLSYSSHGGVDIETTPEAVHTVMADAAGRQQAATAIGIAAEYIERLVTAFEQSAGSQLEINPLIVQAGQPVWLDVAWEVDDAAAYKQIGQIGHPDQSGWTTADFRQYRRLSGPEAAIAQLAGSRASLRFEVINPDGAIWLLLSGGGASAVIADEVYNRGAGDALGNYGEYSGNPTQAETYEYTHQVLQAVLASAAPRKALVIAGAVANFTDVRATFAGIIKAIESVADQLHQQQVRIYVRAGGPHLTGGLSAMEHCLRQHDLLGAVHGPELPLADSVVAAIAAIQPVAA